LYYVFLPVSVDPVVRAFKSYQTRTEFLERIYDL